MPLFLLPKFDKLNSDFIHKEEYIQVWLMVINATFNNASVTNVSEKQASNAQYRSLLLSKYYIHYTQQQQQIDVPHW
jgi:hypothetical protein